MKITVYYQEKPIYLADQIDDELDALRHHPDVVWIDELSAHAINAILHEIRKTDFHAGILLADDIYALKKTFFQKSVQSNFLQKTTADSELIILRIFDDLAYFCFWRIFNNCDGFHDLRQSKYNWYFNFFGYDFV